MLFFELDGIVGFLLLALWVWAILDVIATDELLVRNLPKWPWLFLVLILPDIGAIAWMALGRPLGVGWRPGDTNVKQRRRSIGPEDRADWSANRDQQRAEYEETERRLSAERDERRAARAADNDKADERKRALQQWEADLLRREKELREQAERNRPDPAAG